MVSRARRHLKAAWKALVFLSRMIRLTRKPLTSTELAVAKNLYDNCGGLSDFFELRNFLHRCGQFLADEEIRYLLRSCGVKDNSYLTFPNFTKIMEHLKRQHFYSETSDTSDAFVALGGNRDGSGQINADILRKNVKFFGLTIDIDGLIQEYDADGSGVIEYGEFEEMFEAGTGPDDFTPHLRTPRARMLTPVRKLSDACLGGWWVMGYHVYENEEAEVSEEAKHAQPAEDAGAKNSAKVVTMEEEDDDGRFSVIAMSFSSVHRKRGLVKVASKFMGSASMVGTPSYMAEYFDFPDARSVSGRSPLGNAHDRRFSDNGYSRTGADSDAHRSKRSSRTKGIRRRCRETKKHSLSIDASQDTTTLLAAGPLQPAQVVAEHVCVFPAAVMKDAPKRVTVSVNSADVESGPFLPKAALKASLHDSRRSAADHVAAPLGPLTAAPILPIVRSVPPTASRDRLPHLIARWTL